jgi:thiamine kinase-like enzyme
MSDKEEPGIEPDGEEGLEPPVDLFETKLDELVDLPRPDAVADVIEATIWPHPGKPEGWQVARLSGAVYLYREVASLWTVVAKFYAVKSRPAERYARREKEWIEQVRALGLAEGPYRAVAPLGCQGGVLFLEHLGALSLYDAIAIRRGRPGCLPPILERVTRLLYRLHTGGLRPDEAPDFGPSTERARKYVEQLAKYGVLKHEPTIHRGLERQLAAWADVPLMTAYTPALTHGDATSANFLLPDDESVVAIDWETMAVRDPAFDLGRLAAEVSHCVEEHGGQGEEAAAVVERLYGAYLALVESEEEAAALRRRARFYQASSALRIARNGWVPRLARMALVGQAMGLLTGPGEDW